MLTDPTNPGWMFNTASTGTYSVAGHRQFSCTIEGCLTRETDFVVKKNGNLPYNPLGSGLGFKAYYKWAEDMKTIYVRVNVEVPNVGFELETYGKCPDKDEITINTSHSQTLRVSIPTEGLQQLAIKLDDNYRVQGDRASKTIPVVWSQCAETSNIITAAAWSNAMPLAAPKQDTEARGVAGN